MLKVGLTGNIGSGKSTVAKMFCQLSCYVYDADEIIKGFYTQRGEVYKEVVKIFGKGILDEKGDIDRKKLAYRVFSNREELKKLEEITHRALYEYLDEAFGKLPKDSIAIVEAALLVEKGTYKNYDRLIVVYAPYEVCKERSIKKGILEEDFQKRWDLQIPPEEKIKYAHFVIDNSDGLEETRKQVYRVYIKLKEELQKR